MDTTIDVIGKTCQILYVGQGVVAAEERRNGTRWYAVDIPLNGRNARVWRKVYDLGGLGYVSELTPISPQKVVYSLFHSAMLYDDGLVTNGVKSNDTAISSPAPELTVITPETPDAAVHIPRDNASPEPRPLVVVAPVLRLFTARVSEVRIEMAA